MVRNKTNLQGKYLCGIQPGNSEPTEWLALGVQDSRTVAYQVAPKMAVYRKTKKVAPAPKPALRSSEASKVARASPPAAKQQIP